MLLENGPPRFSGILEVRGKSSNKLTIRERQGSSRGYHSRQIAQGLIRTVDLRLTVALSSEAGLEITPQVGAVHFLHDVL